MINRLN